jgi:hypothetical protein
MTWYEEMTWCDGCGVEVTWGPIVIEGRSYCCQDCAQGYTCACGERMEMEEDSRDSGSKAAPAYTGYQA